MNDEEWRWIPGFESVYEVSSLGRVRSHPRVRHISRVYSTGRRFDYTALSRRVPIFLSPKVRPGGYLEVSLRRSGKQRMAYVHRLVLEAFVGEQPTPGHQGCHLNGRQDDNRRENLAWGTVVANYGHKLIHGTQQQGKAGLKHGSPKHRAALLLIEAGMPDADIACALGLKAVTISTLRTNAA